MKIYVVFGSSGQYDSYHNWMVRAYKSRVLAEHHAKRAEKRSEEIIKLATRERKDEWGGIDYVYWWEVMESDAAKNKWDDNYHCDCGDVVHYSISEVDYDDC